MAEGQVKNKKPDDGLSQKLVGDIFHGDLKRSFTRDLKDLYDFYLDDEAKERLARMGAIRRTISLCWRLFKGLIMRLTPLRRVLLLVAVVYFFYGGISFDFPNVPIDIHMSAFSFLILLVILMLELKDKLLAKDELQAGRAVQLSLMPGQNPVLEGWEIWLYTMPANDVGGDLVDYLELGDGRLALVLGDVSGKGLPAALLMAKLQSTIRALATEDGTMVEMAGRVNGILCRDGLTGRYATLVYLELSPGSGLVRFFNAGHLPPVTLRAGGVERAKPVAMPVGFIQDVKFEEQSVELGPGDMLIAYSDGLTEAMNSKEEFFGEEGLARLLPRVRDLSPAIAGGHILTEVRRFIGEERPSDDLSMIILKRKVS